MTELMDYCETTGSISLTSSFFKISCEKAHMLLYNTKTMRLTYIDYVIIYHMLYKTYVICFYSFINERNSTYINKKSNFYPPPLLYREAMRIIMPSGIPLYGYTVEKLGSHHLAEKSCFTWSLSRNEIKPFSMK